MESNHLPVCQDEGTTTPLSIVGRHPRSKVGAWLPPGLAEEPKYAQQLSKGHSCIQFQTRWEIVLLVKFATLVLTSGGGRICRSGSLLAAISWQCLPGRDATASLEAPWGTVAPDRVYWTRNFVFRFQGTLQVVAHEAPDGK